MGFLNLLMLFGLAGMAIPILIHLLNRRRFDVVEWGAMQFLQVSETTRRRLLIEEILLMLLRVGLIGVLVLALAAPFVESSVLARLGGRPNRDVVLIFDGSYSMGYTGTGQSAHDLAKEWANNFLNDLAAGDSVVVLQAKQQVVPIVGEPTHDLERVRERIAELPAPGGGCDWPQALQAAYKALAKSQRPEREIILLSDGQRLGWADDTTLLRWELLAHQLREQSALRPRIWYVNLDANRPANPPNWTLAPLRASRAVASAGQRITFRTALELHGRQEYQPPYKLRLEVDGKPVSETDFAPPTTAKLEKGQVPLSFSHRFTSPGSHLVSVIVEPDPPPEKRPPGYEVRDYLPGDNRQDFSVEVVSGLPVLLVDGDSRPDPKTRGTDFLHQALDVALDGKKVVLVKDKDVPIQDFDARVLTSDVGKEAGTSPRVLVLSNVSRLTPKQQDAIVQFLNNGGGVLVTLGERVDVQHYNEQLYRGGQGWLPARLDEIAGDEDRPERATQPLPASFFHPALDLFREVKSGSLSEARFPRWWKVSTPGRNSTAVPVALLTSNDPFLVERPHGNGRVILCTVPLDDSWRTNLPKLQGGAFFVLAHELIYYLAGARSVDYNVQPGQPLRYRTKRDESTAGLTLQLPEDNNSKPLVYEGTGDGNVYLARLERQPQGALVLYEGTREPGVYRLHTAGDKTIYYVVQPDHRESDLTPCSDADREKVAKLVPVQYESTPEQLTAARSNTQQKQELWWWFLLGVIALLCGEVWMTRRLVISRGT